jgi:threonine dehydratase
MVGVQVPREAEEAFESFLQELGYPYVDETENVAYQQFLCAE